jgi:hypothetical protein
MVSVHTYMGGYGQGTYIHGQGTHIWGGMVWVPSRVHTYIICSLTSQCVITSRVRSKGGGVRSKGGGVRSKGGGVRAHIRGVN